MRARTESARQLGVVAALACGIFLASCAADEAPCAERAVDDCGAPGCSTISARRVDVARMCFSGSATVGCRASGTPCGDLNTLARDPAGGVWAFNDTCLPGGWEGTIVSHEGRAYGSTGPDAWDRSCP